MFIQTQKIFKPVQGGPTKHDSSNWRLEKLSWQIDASNYVKKIKDDVHVFLLSCFMGHQEHDLQGSK